MLRTAHYDNLLAALPTCATADATDVYTLYDRAGTVLYVGISMSVRQRMAQHRSDKPWWWQVTQAAQSTAG